MQFDAFQVTQHEIDQFAGRNWAEIVAAHPDRVKKVDYGSYSVIQKASENWRAPFAQDFLPLGCAWLRNIDGRAFLYAQNW